MYDLHATLKMEGGKMRLELVVECAYDDGNKQASMNLTTPPDQHDNICLLYTSPSPRDVEDSRIAA